jgi:hypothetical protein
MHSAFIVLAAGGVIHVYLKGDSRERESIEAQLERSRAEMIQFNEAQRLKAQALEVV